MKRMLLLAAASASLVATVGCANDMGARPVAPVSQSPSTYEAVQYGRVQSINVVDRPGNASGAGTVLGAVVGGVLGNQVGGGTGRTLATVGGAVAGGYAGHKIEENRAGETQVYRVDVRFDDGHSATYDFKDLNGLGVGDRVKWQDNQLIRM